MRYENRTGTGKITSVEFSSGKDAHAFIRLRGSENRDEVAAWLKEPALKQQQLLSETTANDETLLVVKTTQVPQHLLDSLAQHGEALEPPQPVEKPFNAWAWRGGMSMIGQSLQLASAVKQRNEIKDKLKEAAAISKEALKKAEDANEANKSEFMAVGSFAILNLIANVINFTFGGQKKDDPHQLRLLKNEVNASLAPYTDEAMPDPEDKVLSHRKVPHLSISQNVPHLLKKYSVSFGEIGLRSLGSLGLVFPVPKWGKGIKAFAQGETLGGRFKDFYEVAKVDKKEVMIVGLMMLAGKAVSFTAKEPDPYNPTPPTLVDKFREKVSFRLSSVIEGSAASKMAYDRLTKPVPDYVGATGNITFVGGYGIRLYAPYGTREVDMPELYAHVGNALAKVPEDKRPALLAQTANDLYEHFKTLPDDKKHTHSLSTIYEALEKELVKYHSPAKAAVPSSKISAERELASTVSPQAAAPTLAG